MIHPLYLQLQEDSPMNMKPNQEEKDQRKPYSLDDYEYNQSNRTIKAYQFYRRHVSKSLPCVFRGEIADDEVVIELSNTES